MAIKDQLKNSLNELVEINEGKRTPARVTEVQVDDIDVSVIRHKLHLSQREFAEKYGFKISSVRNWEQGRRKPEGPAQILLKLIETQPDVIDRILGSINRKANAH